eukprot:TRINITY_DN26172_c0_g1_i1.p1 TRINITY_DN26172_c0_g1~~TRINITY_DN26172_c0_g1_i1.p1  ORF type:complete len:1077 (+),score=261.84 TRINITY_DN26172_c0_g1_i1:110-3340(+)
MSPGFGLAAATPMDIPVAHSYNARHLSNLDVAPVSSPRSVSSSGSIRGSNSKHKSVAVGSHNGLRRSFTIDEGFLGGVSGIEQLHVQSSYPVQTATDSQRGAPSAAFGNVLKMFQGAPPSEKTRQLYSNTVKQVNVLEDEMVRLTDEELRAKTEEFKRRIAGGETLDKLLPEAFAVVREASKRVLGLRPFDVQLIGGMVLHKGEIAEMRTGEGKTLVAILPAYLNALSGKGVHVVTVNDYLARRDCEWVGQVPRFLGLTMGLIQQGMDSAQRREGYSCDITYVTNSELGFDYLRDNLATDKSELCLPPFSFCIIDEVDSILIDEARTPLIISGMADQPSSKYLKAVKLASALARDIHYTVDEKQKSILLTEEGYQDAESVLQVQDLYDPREQWASFVVNALKAKELFLRDVNYIVSKEKEIVIVDEFTGRVMPGRRWSDGLHQAIEAKEGVKIQNETYTLASISYQNFFLQYPKLCGMTGTAATEEQEFKKIYKLTVTEVPTNRDMVRRDESDVVFRSEPGKWRATVVEVARMHKAGRPVLVGTTSVEQSEALSERLKEAGIPHQLLNAKPENVEREAEIVAQSGRVGAVTIATNMAGRGTDIILGGNPDYMARLKLREVLMPRVVQTGAPDTVPFESVGKKRAAATPPAVSWKVDPKVFPCKLSPAVLAEIDAAVEAAAQEWGEKSLTKLEANDRLSYACEKGPTDDPVIAKLRSAFQKVNAEFKAYTNKEKEQAITAGGLHVIGTERHDSRRIDNQLRGRSGRQGDPGSSRFFLSLEDNLFRIFGGDRVKGIMKAFRVEDLPIESGMLTKALDEAQRKVENLYFDSRKQLFEYDEVLNSQRDRVYAERMRALTAERLEGQVLEFASKTVDDIVEANIDATLPQESWNLAALANKMKEYCPLLADLSEEDLQQHSASVDDLRDYLRARGRQAYLDKRAEVESIQEGLMRDAERFFILSQTDKLWKDHLQRIKFMQQAVALRGYAQRDPLIEYKLEGFQLFKEMMAQIRRNVIYSIYQFKPVKVTEGANGGAAKSSTEEGANGRSSSKDTQNGGSKERSKPVKQISGRVVKASGKA